jgi:hypothetical protein
MKNRTASLDNFLLRFSPVQLGAFIAALSSCLLIPVWYSFDIISKDADHLYIPLAKFMMQMPLREAISGPLVSNFPLPLYEFLLSWTARLSGLPLDTSGRLVASFFFVLGAVGIFFLAEAIFKRRVIALLALLLYLSNRMLLQVSVDCLKETLIVCIIVWGNYFFVKGVDLGNRIPYFLIGAAILISGIMARSTSLIFLLAWAALWVVHKREGMLLRIGIIVVPVLLVVGLAIEFPTLHIFKKSLSAKFLVKMSKHAPHSHLSVMSWALEFWVNFLKRSHYLAALFAFCGLYLNRKNTYVRQLSLSLAIFFFLFLLRKSGSEFSDRYMLALVIYMLPLASAMVVYALESSRYRLATALAWLVILLCPILWAQEAFAPHDLDKLARKDAGRYVLARMGSGQDVITYREQIAFYADGNVMDMVKDPEEQDYGKFVAYRNIDYKTGLNMITMEDVVSNGVVLKPIVMDRLLEADRVWIAMLDRQGIKPDKVLRSIYIYLPKAGRK